MAVERDWFTARDFVEALRQDAQRDQRRSFDGADGGFALFAHVDERRWVLVGKKLLQFGWCDFADAHDVKKVIQTSPYSARRIDFSRVVSMVNGSFRRWCSMPTMASSASGRSRSEEHTS